MMAGAFWGGIGGAIALGLLFGAAEGDLSGGLWWGAWLGVLPGAAAGFVGGGIGGGLAEMIGKQKTVKASGALVGLFTSGIGCVLYGSLPQAMIDFWLPPKGGLTVAMAIGGVIGGWVGGSGIGAIVVQPTKKRTDGRLDV